MGSLSGTRAGGASVGGLKLALSSFKERPALMPVGAVGELTCHDWQPRAGRRKTSRRALSEPLESSVEMAALFAFAGVF